MSTSTNGSNSNPITSQKNPFQNNLPIFTLNGLNPTNNNYSISITDREMIIDPLIPSPKNNVSNIHLNDLTSRTTETCPILIRPKNLPHFQPTIKIKSDLNNMTIINNNNNHDNNKKTKAKTFFKNHILTPFDYPLSRGIINNNLNNQKKDRNINYTKYITQNGKNPTNKKKIFNNNDKEKEKEYVETIFPPIYNMKPAPILDPRNPPDDSKFKPESKQFSLCSALYNIPTSLTLASNKKSIAITYNNNSNDGNSGDVEYDDNYFADDDSFDRDSNDTETFNFLWWYPESQFGILSKNLMPAQ